MRVEPRREVREDTAASIAVARGVAIDDRARQTTTTTTTTMATATATATVVRPTSATTRRAATRATTRARAAREGDANARARFELRNCGDKSMAHLDAPVRAPGDLTIEATKSVIGRQRSEAVNLPIEVPTVSGAHAMIDLVDGKVMVTDLTSTNGTFIDGEELLPGVPTQLVVGGEVIFGDEFLARFELVETADEGSGDDAAD